MAKQPPISLSVTDLPKKSVDEIGIHPDKINQYLELGLPVPDLSDIEVSDKGFDESKGYDQGIMRSSDINSIRANNQSGWEATGEEIKRFVPKVAYGVLGTIGTLGDYENYLGALGVIQTDYSNALTEFTNSKKQEWDKENPIYRENPNKLIDLTDSAFYVENIASVFESAGEFGITGLGAGLALNGLAKSLAATKYAKGIGNFMKNTNQFTEAMLLTHAEGVITGADIYKRTYDNANNIVKNINTGELVKRENIKQEDLGNYTGLTEDEKVDMSAKAAATGVRLNYFNAGFNYTGLSPLFKSKAFSKELVKSELKQLVGESAEEFTKRVKGLDFKKLTKWDVAKHLGSEALQESAEEGVNVIAQNKGLAEGKVISDDEATIYNSLFSEEGLLAMTSGAFGGIAQTGLISAIGSINGNTDKKKQEIRFNEQKKQILENIGEKGSLYLNTISKIKEIQNQLGLNELRDDDNYETVLSKQQLKDKLETELLNNLSYLNFENGTTESLERTIEDFGKKTDEQLLQENPNLTKEEIKSYRETHEKAKLLLKQNEKHFNQIQTEFDFMDGYYKKDLYDLRVTKDVLNKQKQDLESKSLEKSIETEDFINTNYGIKSNINSK